MRVTPEGARFSVPYGMDFESLEPILRRMLTEHADKLRPAPLYTRGQIIETSFGSIAITSGNRVDADSASAKHRPGSKYA